MQVTLGLCRLHQVLHRLIGDAPEPVARSSESTDSLVRREVRGARFEGGRLVVEMM